MKGFKTVVWLSFVSLINIVPLFFSSERMNRNKVDIYLFSDRMRYPENVAYDISESFSIIIFIYVIWQLVPELKYKRFVFCFLTASVLNTLGYFLFYSQFVSLYLIPVLILLLIKTHRKNGNEKRNYTG